MASQRSGLLSIHGATLLLGATGIFARSIELSADQIIAWRALFAACILMAFIYATRKPQWPNKSEAIWLLFCGLTTAFHWVSFFHSMQLAGVAIGMLSLYTFPIFIVLLEPWANGKTLDKRDLAAAILVLLGILIMVDELNIHSQTTQGILWGIASAMVWALRNIYFKKHLAKLPAAQTMCWQLILVALCLLPIAAPQAAQVSLQDWGLLLLLSLVCTALAHTLVLSAMHSLSAKTTSLIACLQPVYGSLLAWLILQETVEFHVIMGGSLIISAAIWETLKARRP